MAYYPNYVFSIFAFVAFVLVGLPFRWHLRAWNTGTCIFMAWAAAGCLITFTNSIVWNGNTTNWAPVWCDISTRVLLGLNTGMAAAVLCINRRLYHISRGCNAATQSERHRVVMIDLAVGLGIPLVQIGLSYVLEDHRFYIFENSGCIPALAIVWPSIFIFEGWPLIVSVVSAVYGILSIRAFWTKRSEFKRLLSANKDLNLNRYFRVIFFSAADLIHGIPLTSYILYFNVQRLQPYPGFAALHSNAGQVVQIPAAVWRTDETLRFAAEFIRWATLGCAFTFVAFFTFTPDALRHYHLAFAYVTKPVRSLMTSTILSVKRRSGGTSTQGETLNTSRASSAKKDTFGSLPLYGTGDSGLTDHNIPIEPWTAGSVSFSPISNDQSQSGPSSPNVGVPHSLPEPSALVRPEGAPHGVQHPSTEHSPTDLTGL